MLRSLEEAEAVATASDTIETPPSVQCEHIAIACLCTLLTSATSANHLAGSVVRGTAAVANSAQVVSGVRATLTKSDVGTVVHTKKRNGWKV